MPWNKAQGQIDRMHVALRAWKEAFAEYQQELRDKKMAQSSNGQSILEYTHEKFADQGRENLEALIAQQEDA